EAIQGHFMECFTTLFGGGRAELRLQEDEEDVLEAGVEIVAQPPGKRLQKIALLSGGEKALTAMALLVSLFPYRPSPFSIPLLDPRRGRRSPRRGERRALHPAVAAAPERHAVHPHHPQPQEHGGGRPPLRGHHGGTWRVQDPAAAFRMNGSAKYFVVAADGKE